jgi:hypothetical protein
MTTTAGTPASATPAAPASTTPAPTTPADPLRAAIEQHPSVQAMRQRIGVRREQHGNSGPTWLAIGVIACVIIAICASTLIYMLSIINNLAEMQVGGEKKAEAVKQPESQTPAAPHTKSEAKVAEPNLLAHSQEKTIPTTSSPIIMMVEKQSGRFLSEDELISQLVQLIRTAEIIDQNQEAAVRLTDRLNRAVRGSAAAMSPEMHDPEAEKVFEIAPAQPIEGTITIVSPGVYLINGNNLSGVVSVNHGDHMFQVRRDQATGEVFIHAAGEKIDTDKEGLPEGYCRIRFR